MSMTRRERHENIIRSWMSYWPGDSYVRHHIDGVMARRKLGAFTDEAIEDLARDLLTSKARQKKMNEENRKRRQVELDHEDARIQQGRDIARGLER